MMQRIQIIFWMLLTITYYSNAQISIGIEMGYTYNHLRTDISNMEFTKKAETSGYNIGTQIKYDLTNLFIFQIGIDLIQKNYSFLRTKNYTGVYTTFINSYLQVPLMAQLTIFEKGKFKVFFSTGIYLAYWLFAKENGAVPNVFNSTNVIDSNGQIVQLLSLTNYSEKHQFSNVKDKRFEFGLTSGIVINYKFNSNYSSFLNLNYYHSLTDQQKKYMINQISKINQTFCLSVGCVMKLPSKKK